MSRGLGDVYKRQLPGREHTAAASEPLAPILFSAWGRLERAGVLQTLAAKWLGAGNTSDGNAPH